MVRRWIGSLLPKMIQLSYNPLICLTRTVFYRGKDEKPNQASETSLLGLPLQVHRTEILPSQAGDSLMMASEGRRVDEYLAVQPRPATQGILAILKIKFDYLECRLCTRLLETSKLTPDMISLWAIDKTSLKPSILGVAHATCPICQDLQKQFAKVFRE
jgi:hypothetical protein